MYQLPGCLLTLVVLFPASLVEEVTAILFAPLWRNKMFAAPLSLVVALDPSMFATLCVIPVIPRRDDIAFTGRHLLVSRCWRRSLDVDCKPFCINRNSERTCKCDCQSIFRTFITGVARSWNRDRDFGAGDCQDCRRPMARGLAGTVVKRSGTSLSAHTGCAPSSVTRRTWNLYQVRHAHANL
jgi:hypothetical protein